MESPREGTGIAIFAFNRPFHFRNLLDSLSQNAHLSLPIYIFIDGPRNSTDSDQIYKVKKVIEDFIFLNIVEVYENSENRGLTNSVRSGIDLVMQNHNSVIVLEDDLVVSATFLDFMLEALSKYSSNQKIGSVSGYRYHKFPKRFKDSVILGKRHSSWGWGTWKDRWEQLDWDILNKNEYGFFGLISLYWPLFLIGTDYFGMLRKYRKGKIDSWSIPFDANSANLKWACLQPRCNLVINTGMDGTGANYSFKKYGPQRTLESFSSSDLPSFPRESKRYALAVWINHLVFKQLISQKFLKYKFEKF